MHDNNKILIIADIEPFINHSIKIAIPLANNYNVQLNELDYFFDWAINQLLVENFDMKVIHHYRHDVYLCMYSEMNELLYKFFISSVNLHDLNTLKGQDVKTMVNGRDLFITRRIPYKSFYV